MKSDRRRAVLYSHDAMGIGHIRRNLLIAGALAQRANMEVLLVCGIAEAGAFELPAHVDCLSLPALRKEPSGIYSSRRLDLGADHLVDLRAAAIQGAVETFAPDLLVVDKVPRGVAGELTRTLESLRRRVVSVRMVLGLRDILDDPQAVRREWQINGNPEFIARLYDAVWIYGDRGVYDAIREYDLAPGVAEKVRFTGYLRRCPVPTRMEPAQLAGAPVNSAGRNIICLVGGGEDGGPLALAFAQARLPADCAGLIVTGPFMPPTVVAELRALVAGRLDMRVVDFLREPGSLLAGAERIVTMGGYNAVSEALCAGRPTLVVPRIRPRQEQLIRAQRLAALGVVDVLHPDHLTSQALSDWFDSEPKSVAGIATTLMDFDGLIRIPQFAIDLVNGVEQPENGRPLHAVH